jgi:hypothetical protein
MMMKKDCYIPVGLSARLWYLMVGKVCCESTRATVLLLDEPPEVHQVTSVDRQLLVLRHRRSHNSSADIRATNPLQTI